MHPLVTLAALAISVVTGGVCARAAGETDFAPVGQLGTAMQLGFGASSATTAVVAGGISMGTSSQMSQTLWAFKAGKRLHASPRAQVIAQIIGALVGALVVVPVYFVIMRAYQLGSEAMPATSAITWKATAEAVHGGLASLPKSGPPAAAIGIVLGTILTLLGRTRLRALRAVADGDGDRGPDAGVADGHRLPGRDRRARCSGAAGRDRR